jgi:hypothetical protein
MSFIQSVPSVIGRFENVIDATVVFVFGVFHAVIYTMLAAMQPTSFRIYFRESQTGCLTRRFSQRLLCVSIPLARFKSSLRRG